MDEKQLYYFIGSSCDIGAPEERGKLYSPGQHWEKFGSKAMFTEAEALNAIAGGGAFVPAADFNFTDDEVKTYRAPKFRQAAPDEFKVRYAAALVAIQNHLAELQKRQAAPVAGEPDIQPVTGEPHV